VEVAQQREAKRIHDHPIEDKVVQKLVEQTNVQPAGAD
jgi:hypothetical protein